MTTPFTIPLQWLRSKIAGRRPGDGTMRAILDGEPFINQRDGVLCWLDAGGVVQTTPLVNLALLASPQLTGAPTAPTPAANDNSTAVSTTAFVARAIAALVSGAPAALDTLKELADAINDDASYAATVTTALGNRLRFDAIQALTDAQQAQALANLGATFNHGRLVMSGSNLMLLAVNGRLLTIGGKVYKISNPGVPLAQAGMPAGVSYIYAFMNGAVMTLQASATGHTPDVTASGVETKNGDPSRTLVGMVYCATAGVVTILRSWANRLPVLAFSAPVAGQTPATNSATPIQLWTGITILTWTNEVVSFVAKGDVSASTPGNAVSYLILDGSSIDAQNAGEAGGYAESFNLDRSLEMAEGVHSAYVSGASNGPTFFWNNGTCFLNARS